MVPLVAAGATDAAVAAYMNRLSDYLFTAARHAARLAGEPETIWRKAEAEAPAAGAGTAGAAAAAADDRS